MNPAEVIKSAREAVAWSQEDLAAAAGLTKNGVSDIERGRISRPRGSTLNAIARALRAEDWSELRDWVESRVSSGQPAWSMQHSGAAHRNESVGVIPIINYTQAGTVTDYEDVGHEQYGAAPIHADAVGDPDAFGVTVVGTSMEPELSEGDIAIFAPMAEPENGDICFVQVSGHGAGNTIKRVWEWGAEQLKLEPINRSHKPRVIDRSDVARVVKLVCVVQRKAWRRRPAESRLI